MRASAFVSDRASDSTPEWPKLPFSGSMLHQSAASTADGHCSRHFDFVHSRYEADRRVPCLRADFSAVRRIAVRRLSFEGL